MEASISDNSLTLFSNARLLENPESYLNSLNSLDNLIKENNLSVASAHAESKDLFPLRSVLVSVGWNLNDDVFTPEELWAAKDTPINKPFNMMHNQSDIIGHITANYAIDSGNNVIEEMVDDFHLVSVAVVYKEWIDKKQKARIAKVIDEISNTEAWFVSMECSFASFDYALKDEDGVITIVERNEATAHLSKHLRRYGGNGKFEGHSVGRVLRDISFIGKGLVNKPANPKSIIIKEKPFTSASMENEDMTITKEELEVLQKDLETAKAEVARLKAELTTETAKAGKVETFEAKVTELETAKASLETEKSTLSDDLEKATASNAELTKRINDLEREKTMASRTLMLTEAGVEDVDQTVQDFANLDDESFNKVVAAIKKKAKTENKDEDRDTDKKDKAKADVDDDDDQGDVPEEPEVEEGGDSQAGLNSLDNEEEDNLRTATASWFESILKSTPKNK